MSEGMGAGRPGDAVRLPRPRYRSIRREDDAAAGVVSILLAILVVVTLITMVTSLWMPEWMETIENDHAKLVNAQFGDIKSSIDKQILNGDTKFLIGNPLTLGAQGFSVFGTDATGTFNINSFLGGDLQYYCNVQNESGVVNVTATGGIRYHSNNVYYPDHSLAFENGAIILHQGKGEVVRVRPQFTVEKNGPVAHLSFVLISVSGVETSITGTGTLIVQSQLVTYTSAKFVHEAPEYVNITMLSEYPEAWERYFNNEMIEAGFASPADYTITVTGNQVKVAIKSVLQFNMGYALMAVQVEEEVGGPTGSMGLHDVVGLWHLNSNAGLRAMDSSRYLNDGTLVDGPVWGPGVVGNSLRFDGFDDKVVVPEIPQYNTSDGVTVMAMIRWSIDPATGQPYANIVSAGEHQWQIQMSGTTPPGPGINEFFEFAVETDQGRNWSWSSSLVVPNVWYHVAGVYSEADEVIRLYINGTLENETWHNGSINHQAQGITFGARFHSGAFGRYFEGDLDEVYLFDRALSSAEIARHYQSLKP